MRKTNSFNSYLHGKRVHFLSGKTVLCLQLENSLAKPLTALQESHRVYNLPLPQLNAKTKNISHGFPLCFQNKKFDSTFKSVKFWIQTIAYSPPSRTFVRKFILITRRINQHYNDYELNQEEILMKKTLPLKKMKIGTLNQVKT